MNSPTAGLVQTPTPADVRIRAERRAHLARVIQLDADPELAEMWPRFPCSLMVDSAENDAGRSAGSRVSDSRSQSSTRPRRVLPATSFSPLDAPCARTRAG